MTAPRDSSNVERNELQGRVTRVATATASDEDYVQVIAFLQNHVRSRFFLQKAEVEDIVGVALLAFINAGEKVDPSKNPVAYLLRLTEWKARDHLRMSYRTQSHEISTTPADLLRLEAPDDASIARMIDNNATLELLQDAHELAKLERDSTAFQVATYFLDMAEENGQAPSNREIGQILGLSHVAVAKALSRYRGYIRRSQRRRRRA